MGTGCSRVAVHFDVDVVDETVLGLVEKTGGPTPAQAGRVVADLHAADVVGLTIAECIPGK